MSTRKAVDAIYNRINSIATIGVVHKYERWAESWEDIFAFYQNVATNDYRAWTIRRTSSAYSAVDGMPSVRSSRDHNILIRGYMSVSDADESSLAFDDLIDSVMEAFLPPDGVMDLFLDAGIYVTAPPELTSVDDQKFSSILAHTCEIEIVVSESFGAC